MCYLLPGARRSGARARGPAPALPDAAVGVISPSLAGVTVWIMTCAATGDGGQSVPGGRLAPAGDIGEPPGPGRARRGRPRDPAVDAAIRSAALGLLAEVGYARLT